MWTHPMQINNCFRGFMVNEITFDYMQDPSLGGGGGGVLMLWLLQLNSGIDMKSSRTTFYASSQRFSKALIGSCHMESQKRINPIILDTWLIMDIHN